MDFLTNVFDIGFAFLNDAGHLLDFDPQELIFVLHLRIFLFKCFDLLHIPLVSVLKLMLSQKIEVIGTFFVACRLHCGR